MASAADSFAAKFSLDVLLELVARSKANIFK